MLARTNLNQGKLQRDVMKVQRSRMASRTLIKRINSGSNHLCGQVFYSKVIKQKDIIFLPSLKKALNKTPRSVARNTKHVTLPLVLDTRNSEKISSSDFLGGNGINDCSEFRTLQLQYETELRWDFEWGS